ncbi:MAG: MATE family efflux transporter [Pseudomonadales bacterium]
MSNPAETEPTISGSRGNFTEGSIPKHIFKLAGVMIFGFLAMTLGQLVEIFYLGLVGKSELAAITFCFPIVMSLNAMTRGIGIGASTLIAQSMGEGDREQAALYTLHCFLLVLAFTLSLALAGELWARPLFILLGATDAVLELATRYFHIWLVGFPLMGLALTSNGMIRSFGNVRYPGYIMAIGPVVQVALGPFLIFGLAGFPELGIAGAAWTFVVSAGSQCLVAGYWYVIKERLLRLTLQSIGQSCVSILHVGVPAAATNLIQPLSIGVVTWLLAGFGVSVVAGFGVASRIEAVVGMVIIGISTSVLPLVGQNWGAGQFERVNETLKVCYQASFIWSILAAMIMWIGAPSFVRLFSESPDVVKPAVMFLYIIPVTIGFVGMITVSTHCFNALRKPGPALAISLARLIVVYVPLALVASAIFGYIGVFAATAVTNVIVGLASVIWNRKVLQREKDAVLDARLSVQVESS